MLPIPAAGLGRIELPSLPPTSLPSGPSGPGFSRVYDRLLADAERLPSGLPTAMEVRPPIAPATDMAQPFVEFPTAVGADGLRLPDSATPRDAGDGKSPQNLLAPFRAGLDEVTRLQQGAERLANEAAIGGDVDLHDVMIASEKASVAMQLTLQVRNKLVEAYQDVMRMQV
ncbi:MAG: flagellar hook-basal body complex protein FliE [Candidatus Sericytochromatia bacterium]|jgi:flagellar hook-basal body complex protein FliE|nr:flagellar hook-basal body complex protein FliE [Candidatus Sericytochromatia bacterium]